MYLTQTNTIKIKTLESINRRVFLGPFPDRKDTFIEGLKFQWGLSMKYKKNKKKYEWNIILTTGFEPVNFEL